MCNDFLSNWNSNQFEPKKFIGKKFHHKNIRRMPAMMKIFYNKLFLCEYFQQWIFPKLRYVLVPSTYTIKSKQTKKLKI